MLLGRSYPPYRLIYDYRDQRRHLVGRALCGDLVPSRQGPP